MNRNLVLALSISLAAVGIAVLGVESAQATEVRRIETLPGQVTWFDTGVNGGGQLRAVMTLNTSFSLLDVDIATSGFYNSRLSTRCTSGQLFVDQRFGVSGTSAGDLLRFCPAPFQPLRNEGAIDDT